MAAKTGAFGGACAKIPATGKGSFSAMAAAPVATAASHNPLLSELVHAVHTAGLTSMLNSARAITVFAPDNDAFAALGPGNLSTLLASKSDLTKVLEFHVVNGRADPGGPGQRQAPHHTGRDDDRPGEVRSRLLGQQRQGDMRQRPDRQRDRLHH